MQKEETKEQKKAKYIVIGAVAFIIIILILITFLDSSAGGDYDDFAECLTDTGAKMYGAYWCPHCLAQKELFGRSWDKVNYIECSLPNRGGQTEECNSAGINGYPTWEFTDGKRLEGEQSLQTLSQLTGCSLNKEV